MIYTFIKIRVQNPIAGRKRDGQIVLEINYRRVSNLTSEFPDIKHWIENKRCNL
jgi:hypothetical protein